MKYIVHVLIAALFIFSCSTAKVTHIGFSAVNNYSSSYTIDGDIFNILSISMTKKSGTSEKIAAEIEYLSMLQNATSYKINGKQLIIYTLLSSENLVFEEF